jgi:hypothetical protein
MATECSKTNQDTVMVSLHNLSKTVDLETGEAKIDRLSYQIFWECASCERINSYKGTIQPPSNKAVEQIPCTLDECGSKLSNPFAGS